MGVFNAVANGVDPITIFGDTAEFDDRFMGYASFWAGDDPSPAHTVNLTLADADWYIALLRFSGERPQQINISDDTTGDVSIRNLELSRAGADISLGNAQIDYITGHTESRAINLTLGTRNVHTVNIGNADNRINVGNSEIEQLKTGTGDDVLIVGQGYVDSANLHSGNNEISIAGGGIRSLLGRGGNDSLTVNDGYVEYADLRDGTNTVVLRGNGEIGTFRSDSGATTVTMEDDSRIMLMKMDRGTNDVSIENGHVEAFYSHEGTNTLTVAEGGSFASMTFSGTDQHQVIRSAGWIGAIQAYDDISVDALLTGGAEAVMLGNGDDVVRTGAGYVTLINTSGGDDVVAIGRGAAGFVRLGDGDDIVRVTALDVTWYGVHMQGGDGSDTADLSAIGGPLVATLDDWGDWQDVGDGKGYFALTEIENLIGGNRGDRLTGDGGDNVLTGGRGNDLLEGGDGIDTFVFGRNTGRDRIADFEAGVDLLDIAGVNRLGQMRFVDIGDDVEIRFGRARIVIEDATVAEVRDSDNFLF